MAGVRSTAPLLKLTGRVKSLDNVLHCAARGGWREDFTLEAGRGATL